MSSCTGCVNITSANWTAVDPTQPMTPVSYFVVAGPANAETWRVSLIQQADATQPALIRLIGENGRYLARSNIGSVNNSNILLSVDELVATDQSIWQVMDVFVEGSALDLTAPTNSTNVGCYISNNAGPGMLLWNVMAAHCNSSPNVTFPSPYFSVKRVPELVLRVNPLLNGYDTVHLPFLQNQTVQIDAIDSVYMSHYMMSLHVEPDACAMDINGESVRVAPVQIGQVGDPSVGVNWTVNFIGDPVDGLVQFTSPDGFMLSHLTNAQFTGYPTWFIGFTSPSGMIGAELASNSTRTMWQLSPAPPTNGQPLWILQSYDLMQSGVTNVSMAECEGCGSCGICGSGQTERYFTDAIVIGEGVDPNDEVYFQFVLT